MEQEKIQSKRIINFQSEGKQNLKTTKCQISPKSSLPNSSLPKNYTEIEF